MLIASTVTLARGGPMATRSSRSMPVSWGAGKIGKVAAYPADRTCAQELCETVLSIYNASTFCFQHEPWTRYTGSLPRR